MRLNHFYQLITIDNYVLKRAGKNLTNCLCPVHPVPRSKKNIPFQKYSTSFEHTNLIYFYKLKCEWWYDYTKFQENVQKLFKVLKVPSICDWFPREISISFHRKSIWYVAVWWIRNSDHLHHWKQMKDHIDQSFLQVKTDWYQGQRVAVERAPDYWDPLRFVRIPWHRSRATAIWLSSYVVDCVFRRDKHCAIHESDSCIHGL